MIRRRTLALALSLPIVLSGCGVAADIAGVHDAPVERTDGASVSLKTAQDISTRLLGEAQDARAATGKEGQAAREKTFAGPALREAEAQAKSGAEQEKGEAPEQTVLAVSTGAEWPRTILSTSRSGDQQRLHVLVATSADQPYRVFADVPMAAGASVPALAEPEQGSTATVTGKVDGEVATAAEAWAKAVAYPAPKSTPKGISVKDSISTALMDNASAQGKDLDGIATYTQRQQVHDGSVASIELADGGQLAFVPTTRTDKITGGWRLEELKLGDEAIAELADAKSVSDDLTVTHAETLAVVIPAEGDAQVVGASEQVESAKGS